MNDKGFTLVELLIVIVVLGIVSAFSTILVSEIIENTRQSSFVVTADVFLDAAASSYQQSDPIWDDNIATLAEIIEAGYVDIGQKDPWNGEYDFVESYVIADISLGLPNEIYLSSIPFNHDSFTALSNVTFRIKLVSSTAIIGFDDALEVYSREDIVFLDGSSGSLVDKIVSVFDSNLKQDLTTDDGDDEINVAGDITRGAVIETLDGDDTIIVGDDIFKASSVDMGAGNDTLIVGDDVRGGSSIDMGEGDDILNIDGQIKMDSSFNAGDGNDTVNVNAVAGNYSGYSTLGAGNDVLTIIDNDAVWSRYLKRTVGTFDGGLGDDILNLPIITLAKWNDYVSVLFSNFETVVLQDTTIYP